MRRQAPGGDAPRFFRRGRLSVRATLLLRILGVLLLVGVALGGHWFDRAGLRDNSDGHVSFLDVVYFTTITVTTVGYGDIVPVSDRARMFDTFVVTPIRIFVFLIFLGSAYSFMLRQGLERWRMSHVQRRLQGHTIVCGYGATGEAAVGELLARGTSPDCIVVVDRDPQRLRVVEGLGVATVEGDATHNAVLESAGVRNAAAAIVTAGRDDTAVLVMLTVRRLAPAVRVSCAIAEVENEIIARDAGADVIVNPISFGGQLLAGSTKGPHLADYVADLVTRGGRADLHERPVAPHEVGRSPAEVTTGQVLRLYRDDECVMLDDPAAAKLEPGDVLIEVVGVRR
ncbi:potassium channel family protein [Sphingomonas sp.]|jgi:voltage-gated potassium channel|uniref:potassium channel family protein n=1 Tax=Sphingomonas sp. TaxID=28214 RepID=UPI002D80F5C0|nr:potassium channel family protein [Sphingomonas sp.]HEU0043376.1 potassium channel family protein [Sphingomonas sp.]